MKNLRNETYDLITKLLVDHSASAKDQLLDLVKNVDPDHPSVLFKRAIETYKIADRALNDFVETCGDD